MFTTQAGALATRTLGILLLVAWDSCHSAMIRFSAQPTQDGAFEKLGIGDDQFSPFGALVTLRRLWHG